MLSTTEAQSRCCPAHSSYQQLTDHLAAEFGELDGRTVAREVARAVAAAQFAGLDAFQDQVFICELVARQQLQLLTGRRAEAARLAPERHHRVPSGQEEW